MSTSQERHHIAGRAHSPLTVTVPKDVHQELTALQYAHGTPLSHTEQYPSAVSTQSLLLGTADILDVLADSVGVGRESSFADLVSHLCAAPNHNRCLPIDLGHDTGVLILSIEELLLLLHRVLVELVRLRG